MPRVNVRLLLDRIGKNPKIWKNMSAEKQSVIMYHIHKILKETTDYDTTITSMIGDNIFLQMIFDASISNDKELQQKIYARFVKSRSWLTVAAKGVKVKYLPQYVVGATAIELDFT